MAFVHPQSCECVKSELYIFIVPPTQTSIESGSTVEYNPIASIADETPIEFSITGGGQDYIDLSNTQLYVKLNVLRADNTPITDTDAVGPINLLLHSLFSEVDISLNDTVVTSSNNTYAYRAYLETLLSYGPAAKKSQLTSALYYKDTAGFMNDSNPHDENLGNDGFKSRSALSTRGTFDLVGIIHSDLFFQNKYLLNDINVKVRLVRNKDSFCLMGAVDATFKIRIVDCELHVRKVRLSPSVFVAHAKALEKGNAKYPIKRTVCKTFTIPAGNLDASQESLFSGQLPTRIVIGCVQNRGFNGAHNLNPFNFEHFNLTQVKLYLDGQQHSIKPSKLILITICILLPTQVSSLELGSCIKTKGMD